MEQHVLFAYNVNIFINNEGKHWKSSLTLGGKALLFMGESETGPDVWRTYSIKRFCTGEGSTGDLMRWTGSRVNMNVISFNRNCNLDTIHLVNRSVSSLACSGRQQSDTTCLSPPCLAWKVVVRTPLWCHTNIKTADDLWYLKSTLDFKW